MNKLAFTFAAVAMLLIATACDSTMMPNTTRAEFERADTNRDGVLSYNEFELLKAVKATNGNTAAYGRNIDGYHKEFGMLDNNKDGVLSQGELGLY